MLVMMSLNSIWIQTYVLDMLSWVNKSQKPKTGLARISRTA